MKKKDWFKVKKYPHIGKPPTYKECGQLRNYICNEKNIAKHPFFPFIHKQIFSRKFRKLKHEDGTRSQERHSSSKEREIFYANTIDSNIYSYYGSILQENYERKLKELGISKIPTAYRSIPLNPDNKKSRNKCNIDFANDVFSFIRNSKKQRLSAMAIDISGFFDNLSHELIKKKWIEIMGFNGSMPKDHYNVYKNLTKFSYVEEKEIFNEFKDKIIIQRKDGKILKKKVDRLSYLKSKNAIAFCEKSDIKVLRKKNYIKSNKIDEFGKIRRVGIPQGSPMSSVVANLYMIDFDLTIHKFINRIGGLYRRYSDDIVIIVPVKYERKVISLIKEEIKKAKLEIQDKKTQIFWFLRLANRYYCFERNIKVNIFQTNTMFEYLGFAFDGKYTYLKSSSLANYYRKMKKSIRRGMFFASHTSSHTSIGQIFKRRLYKRFTYLGAERRRKYERHPNKTDEWIESHHYDWGNYLSYAYMAARVLPQNKIKQQLKKHWKKFHELIK